MTIRAHTNKPLKRVDLYNLDTQETRRLDCTGAADPQQFVFPVGRLDANLTLDVTLFDTDDVVTERPYRIFITAIPDEAPRVDVRLKGIGTAVTPDVMIPAAGHDRGRLRRRQVLVRRDPHARDRGGKRTEG